MSLKYNELNEVTVFLFPLLGIEPEVLKNRFFNSYLGDEAIDAYKADHIFLLHSNYQDKHFKVFEDFLESNKNFVNSYDVVNGHYGVKVFKVPEDFKESYQFFLESTYSKYCTASRGMCYRYSLMPESRVLHHVFNKTKELRDKKSEYLGITIPENAELWSSWNKDLNYITSGLLEYLSSKLKYPRKLQANIEFYDEP